MEKSAKVTISLPLPVLEAVERRQREHGESRSEAIVQLLELALRQERERMDVERYLQGYREQPESEEEVAGADQLANEAAGRDPWP